jgi:hypothetical protein
VPAAAQQAGADRGSNEPIAADNAQIVPPVECEWNASMPMGWPDAGRHRGRARTRVSARGSRFRVLAPWTRADNALEAGSVRD